MPIAPPSVRPLIAWGVLAATCALVLGIAAVLPLAGSRPRTRGWWLGLAALGAQLLAVALTAGIYQSYQDLKFIAGCPVSACAAWYPWVTDGIARAHILALVALGVTLALVLAGIVLGSGLSRGVDGAFSARQIASRAAMLVPGLVLADLGVVGTTWGIEGWVRYAPLADIGVAGDGIGQIPLIQAIIGTVFGAVVLMAGLAILVAWLRMDVRREPAAMAEPIQAQ